MHTIKNLKIFVLKVVDMVHPRTSGFQTSGFKTSEASGLQNVRFTKSQVYKMSGLQNVRSSKPPGAKKNIHIYSLLVDGGNPQVLYAAMFAGKVMAVFYSLFFHISP